MRDCNTVPLSKRAMPRGNATTSIMFGQINQINLGRNNEALQVRIGTSQVSIRNLGLVKVQSSC
jgi:hypothetical protein